MKWGKRLVRKGKAIYWRVRELKFKFKLKYVLIWACNQRKTINVARI